MTTPDHSTPQADVRLREETLQHMRDLMRDAVREGLRESVDDETIERFWAGALRILQRQATERAGRFVLGGVVGLLRRGALFVMLGWLVYALGGWTALAALAKVLWPSGGGS